jgi:hypothetical protein
MARKEDTDTLTKIDLAPDAPTHKLEPAVFAPLRVCPECSLAWESSGEWCPSCGTAFEKSVRESSTPTRVMPRRVSEPPLTRSARRPQQGPPKRAVPAPAPAAGGGFLRNSVLAVIVTTAIAVAFFAGQATRPSQAEVDRSIEQAVNTAKQSAASSYQKAFEKMQAQAAAAIEAARDKALAEGRADAQSQLDAQQAEGRSIFDSVTQCVLHGDC